MFDGGRICCDIMDQMPGLVHVSATRNWIAGDPILDWLDLYGHDLGYGDADQGLMMRSAQFQTMTGTTAVETQMGDEGRARHVARGINEDRWSGEYVPSNCSTSGHQLLGTCPDST